MAQYAQNPRMSAEDKEALKERLGLNQPLYVQYFKWLGLAIQGDLGNSFFARQPVAEMIGSRLPNTLVLAITAEVFTITFALLLGIISAVKQYSLADNIITPEHLPYEIQNQNISNQNNLSLAAVEKNHIQKVLHYTKGNKTKAAEYLGIGLTTLYRKLEEYKIQA